MSFHPPQLNATAFKTLAKRFDQALRQKGWAPTQASENVLRDVLGHTDSIQIMPVLPLAERSTRQKLWSLLSSQMRGGISSFQALINIRQHRAKLGLPVEVDVCLDDWIHMLKGSATHEDVIIKHVLPVDFEQAVRLVMNSKAGTFPDAIYIEASCR